MGTRHKHADAIIAWANGEEIEIKNPEGEWTPLAIQHPVWTADEYRIKPKIVKKEGWVNVYTGPIDGTYTISDTKEAADIKARSDRIACVRIEWEEEI